MVKVKRVPEPHNPPYYELDDLYQALGSASSAAGDVTVDEDDRNGVISIDASAASRTVTLQAAATAGDGFVVTVRVSATSGTNTVTVDGNGAETIDGATTYVMRLAKQSATFRCDGAGWNVVSEGGTVEKGSNANGEYLKYANGALECWNDALGTLDAQEAAGNIFRSASTITWTFPVAFVAAPVVVSATDNNTARWASNATPTTTSVVVRQFGSVSNASLIGMRARAIGRWV